MNVVRFFNSLVVCLFKLNYYLAILNYQKLIVTFKMNKYVVWILHAGLLFGQTNLYTVHKKQKELTKVYVEDEKKSQLIIA